MPVSEARRALQLEADKKVSEFLRAYVERTPGAAGLGATAQVRFYKKRPKGFSRVPIQVVDSLITSKEYRSRTNKQIVAGIQARFPSFHVEEGYLDRPLPKYLLREIQGMLGRNETPLDLKTYNTLSKIKKGLTGQALRRKANRSVSVTVTFTPEAVVIGDRPYKIFTSDKGYKRIAVGDQKLRVDVLEALLGKPS
ncbi:hypothetical protein [Phenylobacterium sp.]|jgi:hypothetical protein|uniref:hypothetical protein n=1 Tax=Phenylobacterium sp. TaxID=1871053 RepID=UPI0037839FFC